jgi:predicted permease
LAITASAAALLIAFELPVVALRFMGQNPPTNFHLTPDGNVLAYSLGIAFVSALAVGLAPALRGTRISVAQAMKRPSPNASARISLRSALLAFQVAISVALLVAAGLLVRALQHARSVDVGFRIEGVTAVRVTLPPNAYNPAGESAFYDDIVARLSSAGSPAAVSLLVPLAVQREYTDFEAACASRSFIATQRVSPDFFEVLSIPVLAGRGLLPEDRARGSIVVNETLARQCWPDANPLGKTVRISDRVHEVVGIAGDAQLTEVGALVPTYFAPFAPDGILVRGPATLLVPSSRTAAAIAVLRGKDQRAAAEVIPLTEQADRSLDDNRGVARLAGALGLLALLLATVGVYGVISYSVEQRRREIGVRMALGARRGQVMGVVLRSNAGALAIGLAAGLAIAVGESVALRSQLYGLSPADPLAYAGVLAALLLASLAAAWIPARRATRVDPLVALRYE